jgi:hypothetical protein
MKKIVRFKNGTDKRILDFVDMQSNFSDVVTYLLEKEVFENGLRDVSQFIPQIRTQAYFENQGNLYKPTPQTQPQSVPVEQIQQPVQPIQQVQPVQEQTQDKTQKKSSLLVKAGEQKETKKEEKKDVSIVECWED